MSGADQPRVSALPFSIFLSLIGWLLIAPVAALIPKRRDWIAVFGRQDGHFLDNSKYFFLQAGAIAKHLRIVFVTERVDVVESLSQRREALRYPTRQAIWFLLRCGAVVVDEASWYRRFRFFLLIRSRVVQLWHGVGYKCVELRLWKRQVGRYAWFSHPMILWLRLLAYRITGRRMRYAAVISTSRFYRDKVFKPAFLASHFPVTGYPRNDFGLSLDCISCELAWRNVDAEVKDKLAGWKQAGKRLVLVAPTFRDSGAAPMQLDVATLGAIDAFGEAHDVEFVFKFHPSERNADHIAGKHFHVCARDSDIYPLFPHWAALVTDYSSISMDFLLVDKPMLFLIPEDDGYTKTDRQLQFDPHSMMPGPVVRDWRHLLDALLVEWAQDSHARERAALRSQAFDDIPQSEAVPKLLTLMCGQGWIAGAPRTIGGKSGLGSTSDDGQKRHDEK